MIYWIYFQYKYPIVYYLLLDFMILIKNYVLKQDKSKSIIFSRKNFTFYCCSWDIYNLQLFQSTFPAVECCCLYSSLVVNSWWRKKEIRTCYPSNRRKKNSQFSYLHFFALIFTVYMFVLLFTIKYHSPAINNLNFSHRFSTISRLFIWIIFLSCSHNLLHSSMRWSCRLFKKSETDLRSHDWMIKIIWYCFY